MYKIIITKTDPAEPGKIEFEKTVYEQRKEMIDIEAVIAVVNGLEKKKAS